jgi:UDP-GlcNAc:undecaprenyl-phosphate GlcNAc-1-phosphate transferase
MGHTHLHAVLIFYCWTAVASIGVLTFLFVPWWLSLIFIAIGFGITAGFTLAPLGARKRREAIAQNAKLTDPASQEVARLDPLDAAADRTEVDLRTVDAEAEVALGRLDTKRFDEKEAS